MRQCLIVRLTRFCLFLAFVRLSTFLAHAASTVVVMVTSSELLPPIGHRFRNPYRLGIGLGFWELGTSRY